MSSAHHPPSDVPFGRPLGSADEERLLADWLDGRMSAAERRVFEARLAAEPRWQSLADEVRRATQWLRADAVASPGAPSGFLADVRRRLAAGEGESDVAGDVMRDPASGSAPDASSGAVPQTVSQPPRASATRRTTPILRLLAIGYAVAALAVVGWTIGWYTQRGGEQVASDREADRDTNRDVSSGVSLKEASLPGGTRAEGAKAGAPNTFGGAAAPAAAAGRNSTEAAPAEAAADGRQSDNPAAPPAAELGAEAPARPEPELSPGAAVGAAPDSPRAFRPAGAVNPGQRPPSDEVADGAPAGPLPPPGTGLPPLQPAAGAGAEPSALLVLQTSNVEEALARLAFVVAAPSMAGADDVDPPAQREVAEAERRAPAESLFFLRRIDADESTIASAYGLDARAEEESRRLAALLRDRGARSQPRQDGVPQGDAGRGQRRQGEGAPAEAEADASPDNDKAADGGPGAVAGKDAPPLANAKHIHLLLDEAGEARLAQWIAAHPQRPAEILTSRGRAGASAGPAPPVETKGERLPPPASAPAHPRAPGADGVSPALGPAAERKPPVKLDGLGAGEMPPRRLTVLIFIEAP